MVLSKLSEKCKACPKVDSCDHKKMEMYALAELPPKMCADAWQTASVGALAPILRERIESPLSPFAYRDELEKALNEAHFGNRFMTFGA
ncbi:hypothetical protein [Roseburia sp. 831b]|uniref:hypothetical protein n=1 Tax=Roseburia sp. 831b TaxID=1261635 RepID=UPI0009530715|nr:hypothetical protein [Roseburia sp. 831b]WVK74294.1 hypothetical protein BIV16_07185 [Roseburia sp. 831b]